MMVLATCVPCDEPREPTYETWRSAPTSVSSSHLLVLWALNVTLW